MRELKFRVWDTELKQFTSPNVHHLTKTNDILEIELDHSIRKISGEDRFEIQQYTGLKDKNGVEIYEGDIISIKFFNCDSITYKVIWDQLNAAFLGLTKKGSMSGIYGVGSNVEVIGNIFENPELLNS